jgi:sugar lactone lactonase YvrE
MRTARLLGAAVTVTLLINACAEGGRRFARGGDEPDSARTDGRRVALIGGFRDPEAVRYDPEQDVFFVANIQGYGSAKDGNGYIARVSAGDPYEIRIFAQGGLHGVQLDAPKGMAIQGDTLWVADIDQLRGFHRVSGAPVGTIDLGPRGAVLLNDLEVGPDGTIYITDTGIIMGPKGVIDEGVDKIFAIGPGRSVSVAASGDSLARPNGIAWDSAGRRLLVASFDDFHGQVYALRPGDSTRTTVARGMGRFDGLALLADGRMLVTSWVDSSLHLFTDGTGEKLARGLPNAAQIAVDTRRNRVAVPVLMRGEVHVFELPRRGE